MPSSDNATAAPRPGVTRVARPSSGGPFSGRKVAQSAVWRFVETAGGEAVALLIFVVLARLLLPEHFGVVALAGVLVAGAQIGVHFGMTEAIIQGDGPTEARLASAFWWNVAVGVALAATLALVAWPAAALFGEPALAPVLAALGLTLPIAAAAAILQARFVRRLAFKVVAMRVLGANLVGGVVGIALAAAGAGVWALVGQQLANMSTALVVLIVADPWRPKPVVDRAELRALIRFALPTVGTQLSRFAGKKLDVPMLALFLPAAAIGHYFLATRLIFALAMATCYTIASITLPVLSRLRDDLPAFREATVRTFWLTSALCLPAGLGLALIAEPLVSGVFGGRWAPSILPVQLLAGFSIFYALGVTAGQVMIAAGMPGLLLRLTLINTATFLLVVAIAAPFGLAAVALAGGLVNLLMLPAYLVAVRWTCRLDLAALVRAQLPIWLAAAVMCLAVLLVDGHVGLDLATPWRLGLAIATGLGSYAAALALLAHRPLQALVASMRPDDPGAAAELR